MTASFVARLRLPDDFSPGWATSFLAARAIASLERVGPDTWERVVRVGVRTVGLRLRFLRGRASADGDASSPTSLEAACSPALPAGELRALVRRLLDLDRDLAAYRRLAARDPLLRRAGSVGVRALQVPDAFEVIARAMLAQQVSLPAARTLTDRLVRGFGGKWRGDGGRLYVFPSAEAVAQAPLRRLRSLGLTGRRAASLRATARALADGRIDVAALSTASPEEATRALRALDGVGPWTAAYVLMRGFGHADAFPASDLGLLKAARALGPAGAAPRARDLEATAEAWRPWRSYAALQLWSALPARPPSARP